MCDLIIRSLLAVVLGMTLVPTVGRAGSMGSDAGLSQSPPEESPLISGHTPAVSQIPDIKYHDMTPGGGTQESSRERHPDNLRPQTARTEQVKVIYDHETERDRNILITLVVAFGISLALNVYFASSMITSRIRTNRKGHRHNDTDEYRQRHRSRS
jgi:hypothetical protein